MDQLALLFLLLLGALLTVPLGDRLGLPQLATPVEVDDAYRAARCRQRDDEARARPPCRGRNRPAMIRPASGRVKARRNSS